MKKKIKNIMQIIKYSYLNNYFNKGMSKPIENICPSTIKIFFLILLFDYQFFFLLFIMQSKMSIWLCNVVIYLLETNYIKIKCCMYKLTTMYKIQKKKDTCDLCY